VKGRASAQIRLLNWAKARKFSSFLPLVKTNGNEYLAFSNSFLKGVKFDFSIVETHHTRLP